MTDPVASALHLVCDAAWYQRAWSRLRSIHPSAMAVVFSDDAAWARAHLKLEGEVVYVDNDPARPAWMDMAQMSQCDHFIISNSSFSWWAAYLGQKEGSHVVAPASWFKGVATQSLGICPEHWELA